MPASCYHSLDIFGVQYLQAADLQTADCRLKTCRPADLQTCRLADLQTCRIADQPMDFCDVDKPCDTADNKTLPCAECNLSSCQNGLFR